MSTLLRGGFCEIFGLFRIGAGSFGAIGIAGEIPDIYMIDLMHGIRRDIFVQAEIHILDRQRSAAVRLEITADSGTVGIPQSLAVKVRVCAPCPWRDENR